MRRIPGPLAMLVALVVANLILLKSGCASVPRTASDVAGTYDMISIDGDALPIPSEGASFKGGAPCPGS